MRSGRYDKASSWPRRFESVPRPMRWELMLRLAWLWATARRLPAPPGPRGFIHGATPALALLGFGDSIAAGIGVADQSEGLVGQVAAKLSPGRAIRWESFAKSGATADALVSMLDRAGHEPADFVLLSCGVNDIIRRRPAEQFYRKLMQFHAQALHRWPRAIIVHVGVPAFATFPALHGRLGRILDRQAIGYVAAAKKAALDAGIRYAEFPADIRCEHFAVDGFHAGPAGCAAWAGRVVESLSV